MVDWRGRRRSDNVDDRRGMSAGGGGALGALVIPLLRFVIGRFGIAGIAVLVGGFFALRAIGVDPLALVQGGVPAGEPRELSAQEQEIGAFVSTMLAETESVWTRRFEQSGARYPEPKMVLFSGQVRSGCGFASAQVGPFYCPADRTIYIDTDFFGQLARQFGAPGDFAAAYVIAHEVGHHVQTVTGISDRVRSAQARASQNDMNALQVRMELQADCYSGIWAHDTDRIAGILEEGDIDEGLRAASAIGDDTLQRQAGQRVQPESFTHGSSEQRVRWFRRGYETGSVEACDTFQ